MVIIIEMTMQDKLSDIVISMKIYIFNALSTIHYLLLLQTLLFAQV